MSFVCIILIIRKDLLSYKRKEKNEMERRRSASGIKRLKGRTSIRLHHEINIRDADVT